ncbi:MAG: putative selenate reductase subunit YgfK [Clostridiales bacterium]|nr:putative selenate reductase subunit YgfK [Clostridiales bacterium]
MSDKMTLIPFERLVQWVMDEKKEKGTVFGVHTAYVADPDKTLPIFGETLETPFGPAAGPNTQLAQNIIAAYYAGSRFFELKTVQIMDGDELSACVAKPCINAEDECYNCEWSTELYVPQAFEEYVKAWFVLKIISKEFGLGSSNGFVFNMSVGYDYAGITSEKIDKFIEGLKDASDTDIFKECKAYLLDHVDMFDHVTKEDIEAITPNICRSITLSTLHGCPPTEIEKIASYLIDVKKLNTYIKCNPTLLGYEFARDRMDAMGYDYVAFGDFHFKDDLQFEDAVPMIERLMALSEKNGVEFGVKITNTFPVDVKRGELPSEEMYMSGRSLFPFSIAVASKLSDAFDGKLRISYSGGADYYNIDKLFEAGIWPITMATTVLKAGGYNRFAQIGKKLSDVPYKAFDGVDKAAVSALSAACVTDPHYVKPVKPLPSRKSKKQVPLIDCFTAPCKDSGCPIHQDIPAYIELVGQGKYAEALEVIMQKNPLPFITGTICAHPCMEKCTRNFYEAPVNIRGEKLKAARGGVDEVSAKIAPVTSTGKRAAVIGGGPAGLAAAYFLQKNGIDTTIYEKHEELGGIIRYVIPEFRISTEAVQKDIEMILKTGVTVKTGCEVTSAAALKEEGYDAVVMAVGASKAGNVRLSKGQAKNALEVMEALKYAKNPEKAPSDVKVDGTILGKNVAVIGGGNSAMDAARAAKRADGVENVYLIYRRTKRYMPADEEELLMAVEDGVEFMELLAPVSHENGVLVCEQMKLGAADATGRSKPEPTGEMVEIPVDTVLAAVGESVDTVYFENNGIKVNERGRAVLNELTLESGVEDVYVVGDASYGPATVVRAIADAQKAVVEIGRKLGVNIPQYNLEAKADASEIYEKKGVLAKSCEVSDESARCLSCANICENCVDVCPNRANVEIIIPGKAMPQIVHVDIMCNECGNCKTFCPYDSAPYKDKFTVFANEEDFNASTNSGFYFVTDTPLTARVRLGDIVKDYEIFSKNSGLYEDIRMLIQTIFVNYKYLIG